MGAGVGRKNLGGGSGVEPQGWGIQTPLSFPTYHGETLQSMHFYIRRFNKVEGGWGGVYTGFTLSLSDHLSSLDRIVSSLYLSQYQSDPSCICTSDPPSSEVVSCGTFLFRNLKFC